MPSDTPLSDLPVILLKAPRSPHLPARHPLPMPATDKVGSGLSNGKVEAKSDGSESSSSSSSSSASSAASESEDSASEASDDDEVEEAEDARDVNIDWEAVLPKVRQAVLDRSPKRREQFVARYLYVTDDCEFKPSDFAHGSSSTGSSWWLASGLAVCFDADERIEYR